MLEHLHVLTPSQISYIPSSIGDSLVQLNQAECLTKLARDLLHVFVCNPAPGHTHSLTTLLTGYEQFFGHRLMPVVYGFKRVKAVMGMKQVAKVIQVSRA